jgi:hypothetical protein
VALERGVAAMSPASEALSADNGARRAEALLRGCLEEFPRSQLTVTGKCMEPALRPGDTALLLPASRRRPRLGEVVLVRLADGLRLHRLVPGPRRRGSFRRTKADRAPCWDPPFAAEDLLAVVVGVERAGRVLPAPRRLAPAMRSLARVALRLLRLRSLRADGDAA